MSDTSAVMEAASAAGIDVNSLDADLDFETSETENTEVDSEANTEEVEAEGALPEDDSDEPATLEGEESVESEPTEVVAKEQPTTVKEIEEIKAQRTELEARFKLLDEQKAKTEKEFQEKYHDKLKNHDELDSWILSIQQHDPDLFEILAGSFQEHQKQYSNPVINEQKSKINELEKKLDGFLVKTSDEVTRTKLDAEMNQLKSTIGREAEAAGMKPEWSKVEDVWADNPKLNLRQAFYAVHGEQIAKAKESKAKVQVAEKKVQARPAVSTAGAVKASGQQVSKPVSKNSMEAVYQIARGITGKAF
jgi:hypothetical protein